MSDYREIWIEKFGEIPEGFDIHHMDENRKNNENLLMLPHDIHSLWHMVKNELHKYEPNLIEYEIKSVLDSGTRCNELVFTNFAKFIPVYYECSKWKDYKNFLLGNLPNIHKIKF